MQTAELANKMIDVNKETAARTGKVLVVDDEDIVRSSVAGYLSMKGIDCVEASNADSALAALDANGDTIEIVVSDLKMPGKTGLELLSEIRDRGYDDLEFIIMTAHGDAESAISALRRGATDFLVKPLEFTYLHDAVRQAGKRASVRRTQREFRLSLIDEVNRKAVEVRSLAGKVDAAYEDSVRHLAVAAEYRDTDTGQHIWRIGAYAGMIARHLGWPEEKAKEIELAAPLHDIGKIGIPDSILIKKGGLTAEEFEAIKEHGMIGHKILSVSDQPVMECAAVIALTHHERWDGSGYPAGLCGNEIPVVARIVALCDVYDALRSPRPYKSAMTHEDVVNIIVNGDDRTRPSHFDPELLELFKDYLEDFDAIYSRSQDPAPE
ncbi:MAG: response regulator [Rhodospirillales bacterium]|jgi:putative two-component system response regulator|nr:response regulator [Rhodospirillales bacterium]